MALDIAAELRRFVNTATWSWQGFASAWATEKSLRQWVVVNVLSAGLAFWLDLTAGERALIVALGLIILAAELFNTAIEEIVDLASPERNPHAGKAKDCGSAAVALTALAGGFAWLIILLG
ncbi:diacylglycerol kinase [Defluviimonas aestuarii]|uniref:diacylglycerol kinase n=1 Tax=Albidovulum aestuarii TaxID=1130726 RepID=UPI00249C311C|nr:diacylglycerol kinase [Defluviimonas aestuarii]MDI3336551.1 diacylglycerol kinase [Defluviimonas aestuarii]